MEAYGVWHSNPFRCHMDLICCCCVFEGSLGVYGSLVYWPIYGLLFYLSFLLLRFCIFWFPFFEWTWKASSRYVLGPEEADLSSAKSMDCLIVGWKDERICVWSYTCYIYKNTPTCRYMYIYICIIEWQYTERQKECSVNKSWKKK